MKNKKTEALLKCTQFLATIVAILVIVATISCVSNIYWGTKARMIANNTAVVAEADEKMSYEHRDTDAYYHLSENERVVYDAVLEQSLAIINGEEYVRSIVFGIDCDVEGVSRVLNALQHDCSYLMWWAPGCGWRYRELDTGFKLFLDTPFDVDGEIAPEAIERATLALDNAREFAKKVENEDVETQLRLFSNYIAQETEYYRGITRNYFDGSWYTLFSKSYVSVFDGNYDGVDTQTICCGYASAFQLLCSLNGIDCDWVFGYVDKTEQQHAWNKVAIDGQEYLFDITFADSGIVVDDSFIMTPVSTSVYKVGGYEYHEVINY